MAMADRSWKVALVVLAAVAVGVLIGGRGLLPRAQAISEGQSGGVIALVGDISQNFDAPVVVISVPDQTIMVYNYSYNNRTLKLTSARTYRFDKSLIEYKNEPPSVPDVRNFINQQGAGY
jgi:hypothetical protein